jgi:hypothetical protein
MIYSCHLQFLHHYRSIITEKDEAMPTTPSLPDHADSRVNALVQLVAELGQGGGGPSRQRTARLALRCLAVFARKQFDFLRAGLQPGGGFEADARFPLTYLLEATARQLSLDADVLLRALGQREAAASTLAMRATLDLADRLATDAILPAVRHGLVAPTVMLTYFQKSPAIRLLPYVPLGVIGVAFSATGDSTRLLAIAHETGHHVYRQITVNYAAHLDDQVAAMAAATPMAAAPTPNTWATWLLAWEEEIFADIYAALVAGPAAALALHELILTGPAAALTEDDGDHPLDALRPQILHTTLRVMAAHGPEDRRAALLAAADALDAQWQGHLAARGAPDAFTPAGADTPVTLAAAGELLAALVAEILGGALAPLVADAGHTPWSTGAPAACLAQFDNFCSGLDETPLPELTLRDRDQVVAVTRFPVKAKGDARAVGETGDAYLDEHRNAGLSGAALTAVAWKAVFLAGDWTTQEGGSGIKPPAFNRAYWWLTPAPATRPVRPVRR